jgi:large subunit ribosomal protein L29
MKASEIRELTDAELTARIGELEEERFRLRFRGATEQLEDPLRLRTLRRDVARLKTIQRERALQGAAKGAAKGGAKRGSAAASTTTGRKTAAKKGASTKRAGTTQASAAKKAPAKKAATGAGR